jgi:hypothetical protein
MNIEIQKSFDFAADLVKQLITLSTAIIAITVTFAKDIFVVSGSCAFEWLFAAWIMFFICIFFGIWTLMALTGTLNPIKQSQHSLTIQGVNCRVPASLQILTFLLGLAFTITYAIKSL